MDETRDYHTMWSNSEKGRQVTYDITFMWNLSYDTKGTYLWNRNRLTRYRGQTCGCQGAGREGEGWTGLGVWYPARLLCPWNSPGKNAGVGFPWWLGVGGTGSIPDLGRGLMLQSNSASVSELLSLCRAQELQLLGPCGAATPEALAPQSPCSTREASAMRSLRAATRELLLLLQLE